MDQELRNSLKEIKTTIDTNAVETRATVGQVHEKINAIKDELKQSQADHNQESGERATELRVKLENQERETKRVETDAKAAVDDHWDWHTKQKTRNWQMWVAIVGAVFAALMSLGMKACEMASGF